MSGTREAVEGLCESLRGAGVAPIAWPGGEPANAGQLLNAMVMNNAPFDDMFARIEAGTARVTDDWFLTTLRQYAQLAPYFQDGALGAASEPCQQLFAQGGAAMLATSAFVRSWGWLIALALAGGVGTLMVMRRNEAFRERFDAFWLTLPLVGRLARGYNAARFAGTLAMLAGAGVPILKALQAASETLSNRAMRADAMAALVQVREGAPLASALAGKKRFPGLLAMFARLGEQTGQLPLTHG